MALFKRTRALFTAILVVILTTVFFLFTPFFMVMLAVGLVYLLIRADQEGSDENET